MSLPYAILVSRYNKDGSTQIERYLGSCYEFTNAVGIAYIAADNKLSELETEDLNKKHGEVFIDGGFKRPFPVIQKMKIISDLPDDGKECCYFDLYMDCDDEMPYERYSVFFKMGE